MNKTKIDWCDMTWNPVTGCLHDCPYCYARKIARRFGNSEMTPEEFRIISKVGLGWQENIDYKIINSCFEINQPVTSENKIMAYPVGFMPTFHRYRLDEPSKIKNPQKIFVCSMADLFGDWVPEEWFHDVFQACKSAPQHTYLFLTKNPRLYAGAWLQDAITDYNLQKHSYFGISVCNQEMMNEAIACFDNMRIDFETFLSIEPIQEQVKIPDVIKRYRGFINWVIIGAETGNRKEKVIPKKEWIEEIAFECKKADIPLFIKESLRRICGKDLIQEFPEGMK